MADYFTCFSVLVKLPSQKAVDYALGLAARAAKVIQEGTAETSTKGFPPPFVEDVLEDWVFETEKAELEQSREVAQHGIWVYGEARNSVSANKV